MLLLYNLSRMTPLQVGRMKIQNKPDVSQAFTKSSDTSATSSSENDFFSDLIAEMLSPEVTQPSNQPEGEKMADGNVNEQENQDVIPDIMLDVALTGNEQAVQYTALKETINANLLKEMSYQNAPTVAVQTPEMKAQIENTLLAKLANQASTVKMPAQANASTLLSQAYLEQEGEVSSVQKLINSASTQSVMQAEEETQTLDLALPLDNVFKKENSQKIPASLDSLKMPIDNNHASTETFAMMFKSQKGLVNYEADANPIVAKLIDVGNMVTPQLAVPAQTNEQPLANFVQRSANLTEPTFTANKATQPEYELKVELFSSSSDPLAKDTYHANIKIYPPELGAMLAKLKVSKNGAELTILTDNNRIKEIVESNLTQLKENFREADINLTKIQVDVQQQQSHGHEQQNPQQKTADSQAVQQGLEFNSVTPKAKTTVASDSLIDTYA